MRARFISLMLMAIFFAGCVATPPGTTANGYFLSPAKDTPVQVYNKLNRDVRNVRIQFAAAQVFAAVVGHPIPQVAVEKFNAAADRADDALRDVAEYLKTHPEIANTPAAKLDENTVAALIVDALKKYIQTPTDDGPEFLPVTAPSQ